MTFPGWWVGTTLLAGLVAVTELLLKRAPAGVRRELWTLVPLLAWLLPLLSLVLPDLPPGAFPDALERSDAATRAGDATPVVFLLWCAGVGVMFTRAALGRQFRCRILDLARAAPGTLQARGTAAATHAGIHRPIRVLTSVAVRSPITWGVRAPTIALPPDAVHWPSERLDAVLAHECEHVRHADVAWRAVSGVLLALQWFNPMVWLAHRKLIATQEAAADAVAVRRNGARNYAEILLEFAVGSGGASPAGVLPFAAPRRTELERRIREVLTCDSTRQWNRLSQRLLLVAVCVAAGGIATIVGPPGTRPNLAAYAEASHPRKLQPPPLPPLPPGRGPGPIRALD